MLMRPAWDDVSSVASSMVAPGEGAGAPARPAWDDDSTVVSFPPAAPSPTPPPTALVALRVERLTRNGMSALEYSRSARGVPLPHPWEVGRATPHEVEESSPQRAARLDQWFKEQHDATPPSPPTGARRSPGVGRLSNRLAAQAAGDGVDSEVGGVGAQEDSPSGGRPSLLARRRQARLRADFDAVHNAEDTYHAAAPPQNQNGGSLDRTGLFLSMQLPAATNFSERQSLGNRSKSLLEGKSLEQWGRSPSQGRRAVSPESAAILAGQGGQRDPALLAVFGLLRLPLHEASAEIRSPAFADLICKRPTLQLLQSMRTVASRFSRRGAKQDEQQLLALRETASLSPELYDGSSARPAFESSSAGDDNSTVVTNRQYYQKLRSEHLSAEKQLQGSMQEANRLSNLDMSALDRVLGMMGAEPGAWAQLAQKDEFRLLLCGQASRQLLSMLMHSSKRAHSRGCLRDGTAIGALIEGVRRAMAGECRLDLGLVSSAALSKAEAEERRTSVVLEPATAQQEQLLSASPSVLSPGLRTPLPDPTALAPDLPLGPLGQLVQQQMSMQQDAGSSTSDAFGGEDAGRPLSPGASDETGSWGAPAVGDAHVTQSAEAMGSSEDTAALQQLMAQQQLIAQQLHGLDPEEQDMALELAMLRVEPPQESLRGVQADGNGDGSVSESSLSGLTYLRSVDEVRASRSQGARAGTGVMRTSSAGSTGSGAGEAKLLALQLDLLQHQTVAACNDLAVKYRSWSAEEQVRNAAATRKAAVAKARSLRATSVHAVSDADAEVQQIMTAAEQLKMQGHAAAGDDDSAASDQGSFNSVNVDFVSRSGMYNDELAAIVGAGGTVVAQPTVSIEPAVSADAKEEANVGMQFRTKPLHERIAEQRILQSTKEMMQAQQQGQQHNAFPDHGGYSEEEAENSGSGGPAARRARLPGDTSQRSFRSGAAMVKNLNRWPRSRSSSITTGVSAEAAEEAPLEPSVRDDSDDESDEELAAIIGSGGTATSTAPVQPIEPAVKTEQYQSHVEEGIPPEKKVAAAEEPRSILRKPPPIVAKTSNVTASGFAPVPDPVAVITDLPAVTEDAAADAPAPAPPPEPAVTVVSRSDLKLSDTVKIRHQAATKMQAHFRGSRDRQRTATIVAQRNRASLPRRKSIVKFQSAARMSMYGTKVTKECEQKRVRAVTMGAPEVQASYELFRSMPLFEGVEYEAVLQLAVQAKKIEVEDGQDVVTEGERHTACMFIVADGELECVESSKGLLANYTTGQYFGELALFQKKDKTGQMPTRPASLRGLADESTVLQLWKHQLEAYPSVMKRLRPVGHNIRNRVRTKNKQDGDAHFEKMRLRAEGSTADGGVSSPSARLKAAMSATHVGAILASSDSRQRMLSVDAGTSWAQKMTAEPENGNSFMAGQQRERMRTETAQMLAERVDQQQRELKRKQQRQRELKQSAVRKTRALTQNMALFGIKSVDSANSGGLRYIRPHDGSGKNQPERPAVPGYMPLALQDGHEKRGMEYLYGEEGGLAQTHQHEREQRQISFPLDALEQCHTLYGHQGHEQQAAAVNTDGKRLTLQQRVDLRRPEWTGINRGRQNTALMRQKIHTRRAIDILRS